MGSNPTLSASLLNFWPKIELSTERPYFRPRNVQPFRLTTWVVGLCGSIITEEATNPLAAPDAAVLRLNLNAVDQLVAKPLMVALAMVMDHEVGERTSEVPLTQRNDPIQAFLFDGPNKALRMRIAVRGTERCLDHAHTRRLEQVSNRETHSDRGRRSRAVSVEDALAGSGELTYGLEYGGLVWIGVEPTIETRRECSSSTNSV